MHKTAQKSIVILSAVIAAFGIFFILPIASSAADSGRPARNRTDTYLIGDADGDNEITILDATKIQRVLAGLESDSDGMISLRAGMTGDELNIMDATVIQRYLAEMEIGCPVGQYASLSHTEPPPPATDEYELPIIA